MRLLITALVSLAVLLTPLTLLADKRSRDGVSLESAVSNARDHYRGRVISAETGKRNGNAPHKIRILTEDGRVRRLRVDPETGEYLQPSRPPRR